MDRGEKGSDGNSGTDLHYWTYYPVRYIEQYSFLISFIWGKRKK